MFLTQFWCLSVSTKYYYIANYVRNASSISGPVLRRLQVPAVPHSPLSLYFFPLGGGVGRKKKERTAKLLLIISSFICLLAQYGGGGQWKSFFPKDSLTKDGDTNYNGSLLNITQPAADKLAIKSFFSFSAWLNHLGIEKM